MESYLCPPTHRHTHTQSCSFFLKRDQKAGGRVREDTKKSLGEKDARKRNLDDLIIITKLQMMSDDGTVGFEEWK